MRVERMGDYGLILRDLPVVPYLATKALAQMEGVEEAVASYETVGLYFRDCPSNLDRIVDTVTGLLTSTSSDAVLPCLRRIPVCYEMGDDLAATADLLGMDREDLIRWHQAETYSCYAVGFSPGFAYLGYLPTAISGVGRLASPRPRVLPGSVGITGKQTAVYPSATPGGWRLIGRTPLQLVDVADGYFPIEAGDRVQFFRIDEQEFHRLEGARL